MEQRRFRHYFAAMKITQLAFVGFSFLPCTHGFASGTSSIASPVPELGYPEEIAAQYGRRMQELSFQACSSGGAPCLPHGNLKDFETDACTLFPDGPPSNPTLWQHCCIHHDLLYWKGGSFEERKAADQELYACVADTGYVATANAMYWGVRSGGNPWLKTYWRWGYGWENLRGYTELNRDEIELVSRKAPRSLDEMTERLRRGAFLKARRPLEDN